jgi:hypothetical protein
MAPLPWNGAHLLVNIVDRVRHRVDDPQSAWRI